MSFVQITKSNIGTEHICCALGTKQYESAVREKKQWLTERMEEGLVFYRLNERAKVFIEYIPADLAWVPIHASNYMYINCLWVSGKYKNKGYAKQLLEHCKDEAVKLGMDGIVHIVGKKNYPYLSDRRFFEYMGFDVVDEAGPYFQLVALKWNKQAPQPSFKQQAAVYPIDQGICIYYTAQCPYAVGIVEELKEVAANKKIPFKACKITTREQAQNSPLIWTTFGVFYNGKFITHEIMSPNKFDRLVGTLLGEEQQF